MDLKNKSLAVGWRQGFCSLVNWNKRAVAAAGGGIIGVEGELAVDEDEADACARRMRRLEVEDALEVVRIEEDEIRVFPSPGGLKKPDQPVYAHNDHRIAMAASLLLSLTGGELMGAECVRNSWPEFYEALSKLGIEVSLHDDPQR